MLSDTKSLFWSRAAIYGGLWGAVEITLGGFLHTLRIPVAGIFLAACEAGYLVAVRRITGARFMALAVAFVAGCVRSLAPAGALINPFVGIIMEGFMIEAAFLVLPGFWLPAFLGGAAATLWALVQLILTQLIFFGAGAIKFYELVHKAAQRIMGVSFAGFALLGVLVLLALFGGLFGLWGMKIGGVVLMRKQSRGKQSKRKQPMQVQPMQVQQKGRGCGL